MGFSAAPRFVLFLGIAAAILAAGCLQGGYAQKCSKITDSVQKDSCLEYMAVWYQDPYTCYGIMNHSLKEGCFEKALDEKEARLLQAQHDYSQNNIDVVVEGKKAGDRPPPESTAGADPEVESCVGSGSFGLDGCLNKVAVERQDLAMCGQISSESYRRPCISNIAILKKGAADCGSLERADDRQLCEFYASAN